MDRFGLSMALQELTTLRPVALASAVVAPVLVFRFQWSVLRTLGVSALRGLAAAGGPSCVVTGRGGDAVRR